MKRIGVMGCGVVAEYGHIPAILETEGLELAAVYDPNAAQFEKIKHRAGHVPTFTDVDAFFGAGLDAVAVTSPAPRHLENVEQAARHGAHILCEKPLAMRDDEIVAMIDTADKAGVSLTTAFCYRFSPVAQEIKRLVAEGAIGRVRAMRLIYIWNLHGKYDPCGDGGEKIVAPRRVGRMLEGGPMVDCGVHQIDLARWWTGSEIVHQTGAAAWVDEEWEAPDHMWLHLDHANGAHTAVEMSFSYTHTAAEPIDHFSYHLIGTDGLIRYDRNGWHFEVRTPHGTHYPPGASEKNFHGMYAQWRDALHANDFSTLPSARDGLIVTRIARSGTDAVIADRHARLHTVKM